MILRITQKLAKKIDESPTADIPLGPNPFADWSAHLFTAARTQYILLTNTASLYSVLIYGRGIPDGGEFISRSLSEIRDFLLADGFAFQFTRFIGPETGEIIFAKSADRRTLGSINDLINVGKCYLLEMGHSPFEAAQKLNEMPMSIIGYDHPRAAFAKLKPPSQIS